MPSPESLGSLLLEIAQSYRFTNFGPMAGCFETELSALLGAGTAVCVTSSCTAALEAALGVLGLALGAKVLMPSYTSPATAQAVRWTGFNFVTSIRRRGR